MDIKAYSIKSTVYSFASAWKDVKTITLSDSYKTLMFFKDTTSYTDAKICVALHVAL